MIVIVIPAKGGSSRLPNKNMVPLNGRPMLDYTIDEALASRRADRVYVSTDSDAIAAHAAARGIAVIRRPESLGGDVPILDVYRHAVANMPEGDKVTVVVGLQPDHPDRDVRVDETIAILEREQADRVMSKQADGVKNGAHYVLSRHFVDHGESRKDITIIDDCTNIHFAEELDRAARRLSGQGA
ncbi:MAG: NTP transferase domain-containing protein [Pseudomonadota bacterium]